jgi:hypothetical protein
MGGFRRVIVVVVLVLAVLGAGSPAVALGHAQGDQPQAPVVDTEETAVGSVEIVRDDDTTATVNAIRRNLVLVAVLTTAGLVVYVWHTSPSRRLRIAAERAGVAEESDRGDGGGSDGPSA